MSFERGKRSLSLNLKTESGRRILRTLIDKADVLIDPFRPGVLESLGLSPQSLHETNPKLIIARLTGYGQTGKLCIQDCNLQNLKVGPIIGIRKVQLVRGP